MADQPDKLPRESREPDPGTYLEIHLGRRKRWVGLLTYAVFFMAVSAVLAYFLYYFSRSWWLSVGLVAVMVLYMSMMGRWASKNIERRQQEE